MFRKIAVLCIAFVLAFVCEACGTSSENQNDNTVSQANDKNKSISTVSGGNEDYSVLIAYFSWSGNTKQLATVIQEQVGGDLFEIEPEVPYTDDINELSGQALQEQHDDVRPALSTHIENMDEYDVVFIGYPNWWNNMPMPVFTFLEEYDFSGKTVIPFTTYGDGVFGKSIQSMQEILDNSVILDGLAVQEHELDNSSAEVTEWLDTIGFAQIGQ